MKLASTSSARRVFWW